MIPNQEIVVKSGDFVYYKNCMIAALPDNFSAAFIDKFEACILESLSSCRHIKFLLLSLSEVAASDLNDLKRLCAMLQSSALMGVRIGVFGMGPGLAALIAKLDIDLPIDVAGHDLEDILKRLSV